MASETINKIEELAESVLASTDFFLVDLAVHGSGQPVVEVYVDGSERYINMDECAEISEELGFLIDAHELFARGYRLNVSSPGLNRPLTDRRQYRKNTGRKVEIKIRDTEQDNRIITGNLAEVTEHQITIEREEQARLDILFEQIIETKVVPSLKHH